MPQIVGIPAFKEFSSDGETLSFWTPHKLVVRTVTSMPKAPGTMSSEGLGSCIYSVRKGGFEPPRP